MKLTSLSILHSTPKENPWKISQLISLLSLFSILWKSWWISSFQAGRSPSEGQVEKGLWEWPNKNNPTCVIIVQCIPSYCLISISASISIYIYAISVSVYLYLSMLSAHAIPRSEELARKKRVSPTKRVSMNSSESPRKLVGDITMSALALEQIFQKIAELLD